MQPWWRRRGEDLTVRDWIAIAVVGGLFVLAIGGLAKLFLSLESTTSQSTTSGTHASTSPSSSSSPTTTTVPAQPRRLTDLTYSNGDAVTTGPANVDGKGIPNAFLIDSYHGAVELDLSLDGKYRTLQATIGKTSTSGNSEVTGGSMQIQVLLDASPDAIFNETLGPNSLPLRPTLRLHGAQTLRILVTDNGGPGSSYDEAVIAGVVNP